MSESLKILAQATPAGTTLTDIYGCPGGKQAVLSSIVLCNQSGLDRTFRISVAVAGATDTPKQYLVYDAPIEAGATITLQLGVTLGPSDVLRAYVSGTTISINVFGSEVT
jgi:hypothetical protein